MLVDDLVCGLYNLKVCYMYIDVTYFEFQT